MQRTAEFDCGSGYIIWQFLIEECTKQAHGYRIGICNVKRVYVIVQAELLACVNDDQRVVEAFLGRVSIHIHSIQMTLDLEC